MTDRQNILVVEVEDDSYHEISAVLERDDLATDRFPTASAAVELVTKVPFGAIILNQPPRTLSLEEFVQETKKPESASRDAAVGIFISSMSSAENPAAVPEGVDVVIGPTGGQLRREHQICELVGVVPRSAVRFKLNTDVTLVDREGRHVVTHTRDISTSGCFSATHQLAPVGSRVKAIVSLPDGGAPLVAQAEVVRHSIDASGKIEGMGLHFLSFRDESLDRLGRLLKSMDTTSAQSKPRG